MYGRCAGGLCHIFGIPLIYRRHLGEKVQELLGGVEGREGREHVKGALAGGAVDDDIGIESGAKVEQ